MIPFINFFQSIPAELATFLLATLPITELRGSIPFAVGVLNLPIQSAFIFSVLGNAIPMIFILWLLPKVVVLLEGEQSQVSRLLERFLEYKKNKHKAAYEKYGAFVLFLFVAVPLPMTGIWTGSILTVLFGIRYKLSIPSLIAGVITAGVIVSLITTGVIQFIF